MFKITKLLLAMITLFILNNGYSQSSFSPYSEFGVKVGAYPYGAYLVDSVNVTSLNGKLLGVRFLHLQQKNLGILIEGNYNTLTYRENNIDIKYDFVQVPLLTTIKLGVGKGSVAINLGTYALYILNKDDNIYLDKSFLYGLSGGFGLNVPIKKLVVGAETRYYFNLPSNNSLDDTMRSQWIEFSLCCSLHHQKK